MELRIKEIMNERNITSAWLSEKVGISKVAISNIITGKSSPSLDNILKIADALGVDILTLIYGHIKVQNNDFTALIQHKNDFYKATTIEDLVNVIEQIKQKRKKGKWLPQTGEKYWYVSVPHSWDFENTHPIEDERKDNGTLIFDGYNVFKTEDEAIEMTNEIRALWGYPKFKKLEK